MRKFYDSTSTVDLSDSATKTRDKAKRKYADSSESIHSNTKYSNSKDSNTTSSTNTISDYDKNILDLVFPYDCNESLATALFEYGLKQSSPKLLLSLMPAYPGLTTEHIKSHLQKYRIHNHRSIEEFTDYYRDFMKDSFVSFLHNKEYHNNSFSSSADSMVESTTNYDNSNLSKGNHIKLSKIINTATGNNVSDYGITGNTNVSSNINTLNSIQLRDTLSNTNDGTYDNDNKDNVSMYGINNSTLMRMKSALDNSVLRDTVSSSTGGTGMNVSSSNGISDDISNEMLLQTYKQIETLFQDWEKLYDNTILDYEQSMKLNPTLSMIVTADDILDTKDIAIDSIINNDESHKIHDSYRNSQHDQVIKDNSTLNCKISSKVS